MPRSKAQPNASGNTGDSKALFARARRVLVGGVNSPVRAWKNVGLTPRFVAGALGATIRDVEDRVYIDYVGAWGPAILGHAHPKVIAATKKALSRGLSFGACHELEAELAEWVCRLVPSVEQVRLVNSGTEATMSALRLARGVTGRDRVVKFEGCYHGHADSFLIKAGSGALTHGKPDSPGVTAGVARDTLVAPYNDAAAVERLFARQGPEIACVIVEPVAGNVGCLAPAKGFLETILRLCRAHGALSIFDEVMTGFRLGPAGAQGRFGLKPDLSTFGKVIGGGLPVGAYGGPRKIMKHLAPEGPVYQAGTMSGNPPACAAGLATLQVMREEGGWEALESRAKLWNAAVHDAIADAKAPAVFNRVQSMGCLYFHPGPVTTYADVMAGDAARFRRFFAAALDAGLWLAPSPFEAAFLSLAHTKTVLDRTRRALTKALRASE